MQNSATGKRRDDQKHPLKGCFLHFPFFPVWYSTYMTTIKYVAPKPLAKLLAILYFIFGILIGLIFLLTALVPALGGQPEFNMREGVYGIIFIPVAYALMGLIGGYITAALYNALAARFGGIQVELETQ